MAFTIRNLSAVAEENLKKIKENNQAFLKTSTKAIDYVLSNYYRTERHVKDIEEKNSDLSDKLYAANQELAEIKEALNFLKNL